MSASLDSVAKRDAAVGASGLGGALRRLRDPLLLGVLPVVFALCLAVLGYGNSWPVGFDFRGTLWDPARALLDGLPIYPAPTREAVVVGNPAVYPPLFVLASVPLALLPATVAAWAWLCVLGAAVLGSMWILRVRDWRCLVLAVTSPVVVHGLWYGNLTILLVLPLALAWRYRDRTRVAGVAIGVAVAAKLFVWPLVVWLLLTRRYRATAWAVGSAVGLVLGAWTLVGFQGLREYPELLRAVQDVYAVRSVSLSTVAGAFGTSVSAAVAVAAVVGLVCLGVAAVLVRRTDGDRRAFAIVVAACIFASPIVWPNYCALLFVPIAVTWPRLAPAWFFGYLVWLASALAPKPITDACCPPDGVAPQAWASSHGSASAWYALGVAGVVGVITMRTLRGRPRGVCRVPVADDAARAVS